MALTSGDLQQIRSVVEDSESRIIRKIDEKVDEAREDIVTVLGESLDMVSDQINRLDQRVDNLRIVS